MTKNLPVTLAILFISSIFYAQDIVFEANENVVVPVGKDNDPVNAYYTSYDGFFNLTFTKDELIAFSRFNDAFERTDSIRINKTDPSYYDEIATFGDKQKQAVVFEKEKMLQGKSKKNYFFVVYDFETHQVVQKTMEFNFENEQFLSTFTYKDAFYMLTLLQDYPILRLYRLDLNLENTSHNVNIKKGPLYYNNKLIDFPERPDYLRKYLFGFEFTVNFKVIHENQPTDIQSISAPSKIYVRGDKLYIGLDSNKDFNSLIEINLNDYSILTRQNSRTFFPRNENTGRKVNSFLLDNKLFLLKATKKRVALNVLDLNSNSYLFDKTFDSNSPYYADRNLVISEEILKTHSIPKTQIDKDASIKNRLRQITNFQSEVGLKVVETKNNYLVTIGGYFYSSGGVIMMGGMGNGFGSPPPTMIFTPSYSRTNSLDFYLDKNNYNLALDVDSGYFKKMDDFLVEEGKDPKGVRAEAKIKFKRNDAFYFGYLNTADQKYYIRKFN
ncbi:hypothetical protein [Gaetbulibacter aestuarii]|uniref:6-bladed beta-propeller protein n=1 Tax=Gaetbulibacter aestuarii TaxID=1502358 RepID=A0ABW7MWK0_9FLAO